MSGNSRILLVEDNEQDEFLAIRALIKNNIKSEVVIKRDGAEALDYLLKLPSYELPTVVFLDLKLPKISGLEVLKVLRANRMTKSLPIVILTTSSEESDIGAC